MIRVLLAVVLLGLAVAASGGQRPFEPIGEQEALTSLPLAERQQVEDWLRALVTAWNTPHLDEFLDPAFPRRQRLLGAIEDQVPPDTRLRLLSVGPVRVIKEERQSGVISRVLRVGVRFQVERPAVGDGVQRRESQQDLVIRWTRRVPQ